QERRHGVAQPGTVADTANCDRRLLAHRDRLVFLHNKAEQVRHGGVACLPQPPEGERGIKAQLLIEGVESLAQVRDRYRGGRAEVPKPKYRLTLQVNVAAP